MTQNNDFKNYKIVQFGNYFCNKNRILDIHCDNEYCEARISGLIYNFKCFRTDDVACYDHMKDFYRFRQSENAIEKS
jgi:hypothetical protein